MNQTNEMNQRNQTNEMNQSNHLYAVILAGGSGTRFWPLSREFTPKQMLSLFGPHSLFQETLLRIQGAIPPEKTVIVTNERHGYDLKRQAASIGAGYRFLLEPEIRNTAPAIGLAALHLLQEDPEAIMAVMPSDHLVRNPIRFLELLRVALEPARRNLLVTFGIKPTRPETGFGYLKAGSAISGLATSSAPIRRVEKFVEKPDLKRAEGYLASGEFYWNSGIFVWRASAILQEIQDWLPELHRGLSQIGPFLSSPGQSSPGQSEAIAELYSRIDPVSIDYGVMEKSAHAVMVEADIGWHDVGSWNALDEICETDGAGNIKSGNLLDLGSQNSILLAGSRVLATAGLKDMVVVDTLDATLICPKEQAQKVKELAEELKRKGLEEHLIHRTVHRPWGLYAVLERGEGYKIKRIEVSPGSRLSLQLHRHRSEHWVVLSGKARVRIEDRVFDVDPHQSIFIPIAAKHRLENPGPLPLQIIEAQIGEYVEEDDIERFDDEYGRKPP
jgi:mannose-1-phosphate guanylyltransferase/mannose-6-phosphate isomerase